MEYLDIILSIIAGLGAAIPLVIKLVQYVQAAVKEKNWSKLLELVKNGSYRWYLLLPGV